tara:strand:+ start:117 stop:425 length:309 start_codon:yes stop_codon:yes gene_type:complete
VSIDDITPEEWDKIFKPKTACGKLFHPQDNHTANPVTKPEHYNKGGVEAIDYIKQQLGDGFGDYCAGNVHKYLHRFRYKNGVEDLRKARVYLDWLIEDIVNE